MSYQSKASGIVSDYMNVRTIPAMLSTAFIAASLYQFGGITTIELPWISYTLDTSHSLLISLGAFAFAFASSETKQFENYEQWEQVAIGLGPVTILGYEYVPEVANFLTSIGDPLGMQLAFLATIVSWGVAVQ